MFENVAISACAGSGKTYALTQRLLALLRGGVAPGEILAITFTRKAAAEIEVRLLGELARLADSEPWAADCLHRVRFAESSADELNVHTFHGWFGVLLAGKRWAPDWFGAADLLEDDSRLRADAWRQWMARVENSDALGADLAAVMRVCSPHSLRELLTEKVAHEMNAWRQWAAAGMPGPAVPDVAAARRRGRAAAAALAAAAAWGGGGVAAQKVDAALAALAAAEEGGVGEAAALAGVGEALLTKQGGVRAVVARMAEKAGREAVLEAAVAALESLLQAQAEERALVFDGRVRRLAAVFVEELVARKNAANAMSFDDLEYESFCAATACGDVNALLYRLNRRFRHLLVDEFQDTSPLQWRIIREWLQAAHGAETAPSVFIVGDEKQAIYRFRHGDSRLQGAAVAFLQSHYGARVEVNNVCRRLAPPLVALVNAVFGRLWGANFAPHAPLPENAGLPGRVEWRRLAKAPPPRAVRPPADAMRNPLLQAPPQNESRRGWAEAVAARVSEVVGLGPGREEARWRVRGEEGRMRAAKAGDVLLLLPQRTHLRLLAAALHRRGVATAGGGGFLKALACRDVVALGRALLDPGANSLSLAQVLRSPLFGWSEEALARAAARGGERLWEWVVGEEGGEAGAVLRRWREWVLAGTLPAYDFLMRVFAERDVAARYRAAVPAPQREQVAAELAALLDFALTGGGGGVPLLRQFVEEAAAGAAAGGGAAAVAGGDAVRIMTVHGAKGLESPIVVLADCGFGRRYSGGGKDSVNVLVAWPPEAAAPESFVFLPAAEKRAFADKTGEERALGEREYENLFYVALTRARQGVLVFSMPDEDNPRADALVDAMGDLAGVTTVPVPDEAGGGEVFVFGDALAGGGGGEAAGEEEVPWAALAALPRAPEGRRVAPGAAGRGEVLHLLLALLLAGCGEEALGRLADAEAEEVAAALALWRTPDLRRLLEAARRVVPEAEFAVEGRVVRLDLLVFVGTEIWVVDYKTGTGAGGRLAAFESQVAAYARGVAAAYPKAVVRTAFVTRDGFVEVAVGGGR